MVGGWGGALWHQGLDGTQIGGGHCRGTLASRAHCALITLIRGRLRVEGYWDANPEYIPRPPPLPPPPLNPHLRTPPPAPPRAATLRCVPRKRCVRRRLPERQRPRLMVLLLLLGRRPRPPRCYGCRYSLWSRSWQRHSGWALRVRRQLWWRTCMTWTGCLKR